MDTHALAVGSARIDITPPPGVDLSGYVARRPGSVGVLDRLHARVLAFEAGGDRAVLVSCDLLVAPAWLLKGVDPVIDPEAVFLLATHTHSGPATIQLTNCGDPDDDYLQSLRSKLAGGIAEAFTRLEPAEMRLARARCEIGVNRRGVDEEGSVRTSVNPGGVTDPEVTVLAFSSGNGDVLAGIVHFGCHPTTLGPDNRSVSADYPGVAMSMLEDQLGGVFAFINGAAGDVNPHPRGSYDHVRLHGNSLVQATEMAMEDPPAVSAAPLVQARRIVQLDYYELPDAPRLDELVTDYEKRLADLPDLPEHWEVRRILRSQLDWAQGQIKSVRSGARAERQSIPIHALRLGDVFLLGAPLEIFSETGLNIKGRAEPGAALPVSYCDGGFGYLPTEAEFHRGGYEAAEAFKYYNYPGPFGPDSARKIEEACGALLADMRKSL